MKKKKVSDRRSGFIKFLLSFFAAISVAGIGVAVGTGKGYSSSVIGSFKIDGLTATPGNATTYNDKINWVIGEDGKSITNENATGYDNCGAESSKNVLTLASSLPKATLSFQYNVTNSSTTTKGSVSFNPVGDKQDPYYSVVLLQGESVTITHLSPKSDDTSVTSTLKLFDIQLEPIVESVKTTFNYAEHCTYQISYDGDDLESPAAGSPVSYTKPNDKSYTLVVTPDDGYTMYGWSLGGEFVNFTENEYPYKGIVEQTIYPIVRPKGAAAFRVGETRYFYLDLANETAKSSSDKTIIVENDGYIISSTNSSEFSISSGVTLLIPHDDTIVSCVESPEVVYDKYSPPKAYRTLTLMSGTTINFENGSYLSIPSKINGSGTQGTSRNGVPTGNYGKLVIEDGAEINMFSGSSLYCYGYITGSGEINAKSGSNINECMQIRDWRGGTCTTNLTGDNKAERIFPFNQYYVQNIETKLNLEAGATETLFAVVNMSSSTYQTSFVFIGKDEGLFRLTEGYICKFYDSSLDRLHFEMHGAKGQISPMQVSFQVFWYEVNINSFDYILPIHSGMQIDLYNSTISTSQDISLFPGASLNICDGSELVISNSSSVYVYDADNCQDWISQSNYNTLEYVSSTGKAPYLRSWETYNEEEKRVDADNAKKAPDAEVKIDGGSKITVKSGSNFYTTESGANIWSSGGGQISFEEASSSGEIKQCANANTSDLKKMKVVNARLKNGSDFDGPEYTDLEVGDSAIMIYDAEQDGWVRKEQITIDVTVLFKDETVASNSYSITYRHPTEAKGFTFPTADEAGFAADSSGRKVIGWIDKETSNFYEPGDYLAARYEEQKTFYAYYGDSWVPTNNGSSWHISYNPGSGTTETEYPEGLVELPSPTDSTTKNWYLFKVGSKGNLSDDYDSSLAATGGLFHYDSTIYANGNGKYYFIKNGMVLETEGVQSIIVSGTQTDYCYISSGSGLDSYVLTSTKKYISSDLGTMSAGFYNIGTNGIIHTEDPSYIANGKATYSDDMLACGHGLFTLKGTDGKTYYYYAKEDGSIVKSSSATTYETFYVYRTNNKKYNGSDITAGLYCFDSNGRMLDPTTLKPMEATS